jgi:hypothetical protein
LKKLQDADQCFQSGDGPNFIGEEMKKKMKESIDRSIEVMNRFFNELISKILKSIQSNSFQRSIKYMQTMKSFQYIVESLLDKETRERVGEIDEKLEFHIKKTVEGYSEMEIKDYQMKPPKHLI